MLPKFFGLESEDAYMSISEFEEVCAMMKIQQLSDDAVNCDSFSFRFETMLRSGYTTWPSTLSGMGKTYHSLSE